MFVFPLRAGPFHSPKVPSSLFFPHSSGSFKQQSPHKQSLLSTPQKPNASFSPLTNGLHSADPKSPKSSSNLSSLAQEPDLSSPVVQKLNGKEKKKKKRRHSEVQDVAEPVTPPATAVTAKEQTRKKKKKKRKRENDSGENVKERECVKSHLDACNQEGDWCQSGIWSLTSLPGTEQNGKKPHFAATTSILSDQIEQERGSVKVKKKKKKKPEALQDASSARTASEMWVYSSFCFSQYF